MSDTRIPTFRWAQVDDRRKRHLWLGQATACGLRMPEDLHTLSISDPDPACGKCWAYAQGWLDRHDYGDKPKLGKHPDPCGADTRLEVTA